MGRARSCGCLTIELKRANATKHGHTVYGRWSPEYVAWAGMIARCTNPKDGNFKRYGARGIGIAPAWRASFAQFVADVGSRPSPGHSLDRVDNDRGYEPDNVRWATRLQQMNNKRSNRRVTFDGRTQSAAAWARERGLTTQTVIGRLNRGWPVERVLTEPLHQEGTRS